VLGPRGATRPKERSSICISHRDIGSNIHVSDSMSVVNDGGAEAGFIVNYVPLVRK